jgi:hypothetical protein
MFFESLKNIGQPNCNNEILNWKTYDKTYFPYYSYTSTQPPRKARNRILIASVMESNMIISRGL